MGLMNLLKANWYGRVGQTVGAKWKDKSTIRSYTKPTYTNTPAQQLIREGFKALSSFVAFFAPQLVGLSALKLRGMTIRNAIIQLNKAQVTTGVFDPSTLEISRGGLPNVGTFVATPATGGGSIACTWVAASAATISNKARVVVAAVEPTDKISHVESALNSAQALTLPGPYVAGHEIDLYYYVLDYRGSTKVGSPSGYVRVNVT